MIIKKIGTAEGKGGLYDLYTIKTESGRRKTFYNAVLTGWPAPGGGYPLEYIEKIKGVKFTVTRR